MSPPPADVLEPLGRSLVATSRARAEASTGAAARSGADTFRSAWWEARAIGESARAAGRDDAAARYALEQEDELRDARATVLAARAALCQRLLAEARTQVASMLSRPDRRAALTVVLRARLGDGTSVDDSGDGGVVATAPDGRRIDASVRAIVEAAAAGIDMEALWRT